MFNVFTFPGKATPDMGPSGGAIVSRWEEVTSYGEVGTIRVVLARRLDAMAGRIHVVVLGSSSWVGVAPITSLPDDANGRAIADFTGPVVLRAIEHAEVEFASQPEAC
jgi:hypothetical protein